MIALGPQSVDGANTWQQVMAMAHEVSPDLLAARQRSLNFDDAINIQYTSGTTGLPKGATLSHHSILNNGFFIGQRMRFTERDRLCIPVPFYHCFGMVLGNLACVTHGATMVLPAEVFDPRKTLEAVAAELGRSLGEGATGGTSDGNFTGAIGVPTLDGLGAVGHGAHALDEHVLLEPLAFRAALVAGLILQVK